ncbi:hypothetical protein [Aromatoleum buckelii]|uniref:Uncharacterized protein n=1 Tax=Aromatoleum buckelii TaxID=200254 RepID=A0ABX1N675_9RHOO|nr:hypothetical protein [Aromatoleum buckelii]MCK0511895.1 hypothetical protein [Aromatoleum buckelii]
MKKLSLAIAVAATLGAGVANAYEVAVPGSGLLVPNVIHNGATDTTAVGLTNHTAAAITVYWTFFDQDSNHITDGQFDMTANDMEGFVWANEAGLGLEGQRGYLVFHVGTATGAPVYARAISGAAFQADAAASDAAFVPTFPLQDGNVLGSDLTNLGPDSLVAVTNAPVTDDVIAMRYQMDSDFSTNIALWATGGLAASTTVNMFNDEQQRKSVNFTCEFDELCFIDPTTIAGRPVDFTNGFITYAVPDVEGVEQSAVSYSVITSQSFGAAQTLLNTHVATAD